MDWSPLKFAEGYINNLKNKTKICDGTETSLNTVSAFGNLVTAFYEKEIDTDKMSEMMDEVR